LGNDIVFIDTPGVELGASTDNSSDDSSGRQDFEADTKRALAILSSVDVVIFCMTNKYKEKKDAVFYDQEIRNQYEPINVITAGDKRDEGQTNETIKLQLRNDYDLVKGQTVVVSSKEALEKTKDARAEGKDIEKLVETEFTGENLEDFKKLKQMIQKRVTVTSEAIEKRLTRFKELYKTLKEDAKIHGIDLDSTPAPPPPTEPGLNPPNEKAMRDFVEEITRDGKWTLSRAKKKALREKAVEYGFSKREAVKMAKRAIKEKVKGIRLLWWYLLKLLKIIGIVILVFIVFIVVGASLST
jgi:hypothetical protein